MKRRLWLYRNKKAETIGLYWLGLSLVFYIMLSYRLEYDYGWQLTAGDYIRAHGVPLRDVFTYTAQSFAWIDHEWLHQVALSWLNQMGGYTLISLLFAGGWAAAVMVASRRWVFPVLLLAAEAVLPFAAARPALWPFLLFGVVQRVLEKSRRWQWAVIPLVALLWANLHGSFPILLGLIGVAWLGKRDWSTGLLFTVCASLTLVNPYGLRVYTEIVRTILDPGLGGYVQEWRSLSLPVLAIVFTGGYLALWWEYEPVRRYITWPFGLLAAALVSVRHFPLFVSSAIRGFEENALRLNAKIMEGKRKRSLAMWLIFCGLAGGVAQNTWFASHIIGHDREFQMPRAAAVYLAAKPCDGNVFNDYDFGGYLLWKDPGVNTYVDGRMPSWRDETGQRYLDRYLRVIRDDAYRRAEFARYNVRCVVVGSGKQASARLASKLQLEGWQVVAGDKVGLVLVAPSGHSQTVSVVD